jgi:AcrR family transcriptional regulator
MLLFKRRKIMPAKKVATREKILSCAVEITRKDGYAKVNARRVAKEMKCSTQPIYQAFRNMDELKSALLSACNEVYENYLKRESARTDIPPYKRYGMGYIRFAAEERELFKFLFMRQRASEEVGDEREHLRPIIELIMRDAELDFETAYLLHAEMWIFVHGIATQIATGYLAWDLEMVSGFLSDAYLGLKARHKATTTKK